MRFTFVKNLGFGQHYHGNLSLPTSRVLMRKVILASLLLTLVAGGIFLLPPLLNARPGRQPTEFSGIVMNEAMFLLTGFVMAIPVAWLIQSIIAYRRARELDRLGLMTKGKIMDKWTDKINGKPVYCVRYEYLSYRNSMQTVNEDIFQQLRPGEMVFVLYLENLPHLSRLDLD